jgi:N4-gp56 family major capsid protein
MASAITGTGSLAASPTAYSGSNSQLTQAIQTIWSKEILFQAMPILRFEQFAVKKTELGVAPGLTIHFMRYYNMTPPTAPLTEGVRMTTKSLSAEQITITVAEHGDAISISELLLNASFDDVMASASRLLGRNMAQYLDTQSRDTLGGATSQIFGYDRSGLSGVNDWYALGDVGTKATVTASGGAEFYLTTAAVKDAVETLASRNIPRLGETYVQFVHPHQSRRLRDVPEFIEATKYASPGNFMLGEIGRLYDVVFIESTQVRNGVADATNDKAPWESGFVSGNGSSVYESFIIGDNAFGHAISLPVELRDGGVVDFGREHALSYYGIWGQGIITDQAILKVLTN